MIDAAPFTIVLGSIGVLGSRGLPKSDEITAYSSVLQLVGIWVAEVRKGGGWEGWVGRKKFG